MKISDIELRIYKALGAAEKQLSTFDLDPKQVELLKVRALQLNGCGYGYCINLHTKGARKQGELELGPASVCLGRRTGLIQVIHEYGII